MAWQEFSRGKRKKPDVQKFEYNLEDNIFQLHQELKTKTYQHSNYKSFYVQDPKLKRIHKASVKDRVLHHAVFRALYPLFDESFIFDSYSCRLSKGNHKAMDRLERFARKVSENNHRNIFALKCDIKKFFATIDHNVLFIILKRKIKNNSAVWLLEQITSSFLSDRSVSVNKKGVPIGNLTSQLFANIYLNELDRFLKQELKVKYYLRYTDDFLIISDNKECLEKTISEIILFLKEKLLLAIHEEKTKIRKTRQGIDFLGYVVFQKHRLVRTKTKKRIFRKLDKRHQNLEDGLISEKSFNQSLQSYLGVLKHCKGYKIKKKILSLMDGYHNILRCG